MVPPVTCAAEPFEALDRERMVLRSDVLFDSNVIRASDDAADERLRTLANLLLKQPGQGHIWFTLMSLTEMVAPNDRGVRMDLLKRFRSLYSRFGDRVRFTRSLDDNVRAECTDGMAPAEAASIVDDDVLKSIAAGDLVGLLATSRDHWLEGKPRLREHYDALSAADKEKYASDERFREAFSLCIPRFFSEAGLDQCDDIAVEVLTSAAVHLRVEEAKARYREFPCVWTFSLLVRLSQYAQTIRKPGRDAHFAALADVLEPHANDFIDADIAATGGFCGMMITNDRGLIARLNRLYDAGLIRLQGFTVADALRGYTRPEASGRGK